MLDRNLYSAFELFAQTFSLKQDSIHRHITNDIMNVLASEKLYAPVDDLSLKHVLGYLNTRVQHWARESIPLALEHELLHLQEKTVELVGGIPLTYMRASPRSRIYL